MRFESPTTEFHGEDGREWGSDAVARTLASLGLGFIALNPGASYRGLHDSIVNLLGNEEPSMVLCLHEEHAVAVAHGYAKVTDRPMGVAVHSNVGLMHATMALYNAWCDRVPMVVLGATGPVDAAARRPWIDWIHTAADQAAMIRSFIKWDDQPISPQAAVDAVVQADQRTRTHPCAPTYVNLDVGLQEVELDRPVEVPEPARHRPPAPPPPPTTAVRAVLDLCREADRPLLLIGRTGRDEDAWARRVALAETLGASVLCDLKTGAGFPYPHRLNPVPPSAFLDPAGKELVRRADAIVALDWIDLGGTLRQAYELEPVTARVASCTMDPTLHNGWAKDHFASAPVDLPIDAHPDLLVEAVLDELGGGDPPRREEWPPRDLASAPPIGAAAHEIVIAGLAASLRRALDGHAATLIRLPISFRGANLRLEHPLDYLGGDGGGGLGSGPGMAVGAALALDGTGRLPVAVLGDGDFLMGASALWTAAHHDLALLVIVANNSSFFNDEVHQERVARHRGRPTENRWVGQRLVDPAPDLTLLARSLGFDSDGAVQRHQDLDARLAAAVESVAAGGRVLVDVHVAPTGYPGT